MNKGKRKRAGRPPSRSITKPALLKAVKIVGSTNLALEIGVSNSKISDWLYTDIQIPAHHIPKIVKATKGQVRPEELRPDVYIIEG